MCLSIDKVFDGFTPGSSHNEQFPDVPAHHEPRLDTRLDLG